MTPPDSGPRQFAAAIQPLLAAFVAASLAGIAGWMTLAGGPSGLVHHDAPPDPEATFTLDVNAADVDELAQLPGLGPATASRIVELLDVPGIGPATLAAIRPHLRPIAPRSPTP